MSSDLLSAVPDAWSVGSLKRAADVTLGKMLQPAGSAGDIRAPYLRAANIQPDGVLETSDLKEMWFSERELEVLDLRAGDVVVVEGGQGGFGRAALVSRDMPGCGFQNSVNRLRPCGVADGRYLAYYLLALRSSGFIQAYCNVVSMPHLTSERLAALPIPMPSQRDQEQISDYLDHETAQMDELITEQHRLIDLLRERRGAVVDSVIGEDFETLQLGFVCGTLAGWAFPSDGFQVDPQFTRLLRGVNVKVGRIDWSEAVYWDLGERPVPAEYRLISGDIVLGMDRPFVGDGVRVAAVADSDLPSLLLQRVMRLRAGADLDPRYLQYVLASGRFRAHLEPDFTGISVPHLSEWQVRKFRMPVRSLAEQRRILAILDEQTAKVDALIVETERLVELARERRAALITAAVTGQIHVPDRI